MTIQSKPDEEMRKRAREKCRKILGHEDGLIVQMMELFATQYAMEQRAEAAREMREACAKKCRYIGCLLKDVDDYAAGYAVQSIETCAEAIEQLPTESAGESVGDGWIACRKMLPEPLDEVWIWDESRKVGLQSWHDPRYDENKGWLVGSYYKAKITHWRPLPAPPIKAAEGGA